MNTPSNSNHTVSLLPQPEPSHPLDKPSQREMAIVVTMRPDKYSDQDVAKVAENAHRKQVAQEVPRLQAAIANEHSVVQSELNRKREALKAEQGKAPAAHLSPVAKKCAMGALGGGVILLTIFNWVNAARPAALKLDSLWMGLACASLFPLFAYAYHCILESVSHKVAALLRSALWICGLAAFLVYGVAYGLQYAQAPRARSGSSYARAASAIAGTSTPKDTTPAREFERWLPPVQTASLVLGGEAFLAIFLSAFVGLLHARDRQNVQQDIESVDAELSSSNRRVGDLESSLNTLQSALPVRVDRLLAYWRAHWISQAGHDQTLQQLQQG